MNVQSISINPFSQPIKPIERLQGFSCPTRNPFAEPKEDKFEKQLNNNPKEISFGSYQSPLKSLFKAGKFPSVKRGLYGDILTNENASLEHIKPRSKGGKDVLSNYALASKNNNSRRSSQPLAEVLTWKMLVKYLEQFKFKIKEFDGFKYRKMIFRTCAEQGVTDPYGGHKTEGLSKKALRSLRNKQKKLDVRI